MPRFCVIAFDLFDTLITCDASLLPHAVIAGRERATTLPDVRAVLADAGHPVDLEPLGEAVRRISVEQEAEKWRTGREFPSAYRWTAVLAALDIPPADGLVEAVVWQHMRTMCAAWSISAADRAAVKRLGERHALALLSNFDHGPSARALLERLGLAAAFAYIGISDELGWRKPEARLFEGVLAALRTEASTCLFVGDSIEFDIAGAQAVGMPTAWINRKAAAFSADGPPPDFTAASVAELESLLQPPPGCA